MTAADRWLQAHRLIAAQAGPDDRPGNVADQLRRVCAAAVGALSAAGVGVSVLSAAGAWGFAVASDPDSQYMEELQFTLGEGPCLDAVAARHPVLVADVSGQGTRWPLYASAAQERGIRSVFAFPLGTGATNLGVMDVFRTRAGGMSPDEVAQSLTFAEIARTTMLDGQHEAPGGEVPEGFNEAPGHRPEVFQAQGMVMVQLGVSLDEALLRLRAYAFAHGRMLPDVARDVVARQLRFDEDPR